MIKIIAAFIGAAIVALGIVIPHLKRIKELGKCKYFASAILIIAGVVVFAINVINLLDVPEPSISISSDRTSIIISNDSGTKTMYKIGGNGKWRQYKKPVVTERNTSIEAYSYTLTPAIKSSEASMGVKVDPNTGLIYNTDEDFKDSVKSIKASYIYRDMNLTDTGNAYAGYTLSPDDFNVKTKWTTGKEERIDSDFSFTPTVLEKGENIITITYKFGKIDKSADVIVNADDPGLIDISSEWLGDERIGKAISLIRVKGKFADGKKRILSSNQYVFSPTEISSDDTKVTISVGNGIQQELSVSADDSESTGSGVNSETFTLIDTNVRYSYHLDGKDDENKYKIKIPDANGILRLKLEHKVNDDSSLYCVGYLYDNDAEENPILKLDSGSSETKTESNRYRLSKGTYYIIVAGGDVENARYSIEVEYKKAGNNSESEPNDDYDKATIIAANTEYVGNLSDSHDKDFYKLNLKQKGKIRLDFKHQLLDDRYTHWAVHLYDSNNDELAEFVSIGSDATTKTKTFRVPAGTIYIKVAQSMYNDDTDMDYKIKVHYTVEGKKAETEPNNDYETATKINLGSTITGNTPNDDVDFYSVKIPNRRKISITFKHSPIDTYNSMWVCSLIRKSTGDTVNNDDEHDQCYIKGSIDSTISRWSRLTAGRYYIKVESADRWQDNSDDDYSITVA